MHDLRSAGFVVNPGAGSKKWEKWTQEIEGHFSGKEFVAEVVRTETTLEAKTAVGRLAESHPIVFAVGGDGTAHHVAQGIVGSKCLFGVLPNGSGNDFSRVVRTPKGVGSALRRLEQGSECTPIDTIEVVAIEQDNPVEVRRWCINTVGIGFDAAVSAYKTKIPVLKGLPLYFASSMLTLLDFTPFDYSIAGLEDPETVHTGLMVAAGNGEFEGGGFRVFPGADPNDGSMNLVEVRIVSKLAALPVLTKALGGGHIGSRGIVDSKTPSAIIRLRQPRPVHVDGEVITDRAEEVRLTVRPNSLNVLRAS